MLSSAKVGTTSWQYYVEQGACRASDYYLGQDEELGRWEGRGLDELGLERGAAVTEQQLEALFGRALNPTTGERLGRAWRADGVTGYDLTLSAPKSVSALHVLDRVLAGRATSGASGRSSSLAWQDMLVEGAVIAAARGQLDGAVQRTAQLELFTRTTEPTAAALPVGVRSVAQVATAAHDIATRTALRYLDTHAGLSRRGTDGTEQVATAGFVAALFTHHTSRAGDPQLHTHALLLNKVKCADGAWRTLDGHELYAHKKSAGMIYQAILRNELHRELGVVFDEVSTDGQAEILGIDVRLLDTWSKRAHAVTTEAEQAINGYAAMLGRDLTPAEAAAVTKVAVLKTRQAKTHEHPEASRDRWQAEAKALGIDLERLLPDAQQAAARQAAGAAVLSVEELAERALLEAGRTRAVFGRADVAGQVARLLPTTGATADQVLAQIEQTTARALQLADAVPVGTPVHGVTPRVSDARFATVEILTAEARVLTAARTGQRTGAGLVGWDQVRDVLRQVRASGTSLDRSQVEALLHLTTRGNSLDVLTAPAGAGKTATLGAAAAAWQQAGYRVIGLAPSARAAAELAAAITHRAAGAPPGGDPSGSEVPEATRAGSRTDTLAKWLHTRATVPDLDTLDPTADVRLGKAEWARLDPRTVLVVDEASMASTLDLDTLTSAAQAAGAKLVLVGDPAQIGVINGPGGMLAHLARDGHAVALSGIHRFTQEWEKHASLALRDGHPDALQPYLQEQRLHACADGDAAADAVFAHWQQATGQGLDALMLARTRLDVDELNHRARLAAQADGRISGPTALHGGRQWQPGDLLRTRKNQRALPVGDAHVRNGDRYRVLGHAPDGGLVVEDLTGRGRVTLPAAYVAKHCEYGWAATIDGSQGATADVGILLARPGLDREHLYVAMTRGRQANHAYLTPDPASQPDQHLPTPRPTDRQAERLERDCLQMLQTALVTSGAQDTAHTALQQARAQARTAAATTRQPEARPPAAEPPRTTVSVPAPRTSNPTDDTATRRAHEQQREGARERLQELERQRAELASEASRLRTAQLVLSGQLGDLPRHALPRRRSLTRQLEDLTRRDATLSTARTDLDQQIVSARQELRALEQPTPTPAEQLPTRLPQPVPRPLPQQPNRGLPTPARPAPSRRGLTTTDPARHDRHRDGGRDIDPGR